MSANSSSLFGPRLSALYLLNLCGGMSMGVFGLLSATWMKQLGASPLAIGLVSSSYYALQILGAVVAERLLRRVPARAAIICGLVVAGLASPLFVLATQVPTLSIVRGLAGLGVGIAVTAGQTCLASLMPPEHRGVVSGLYALAFAIGLALGPLVGPALYQLDPKFAAAWGGLVFLGAAVLARARLGTEVLAVTRQRRRVAGKLSTSLHAIFAYGLAEAALFSVYPGVLVERGLSVRAIGFVFSTFVVGSIVATLPVTRWADRYGRRGGLLCCALVGTVSVLGLAGTSSVAWLMLLAFVAGGSVGSSYALAMALVSDALTDDELPSGMALFTTALGIGCAVGPVIAGGALSGMGPAWVFVPTCVVLALLVPRLWFESRASSSMTAEPATGSKA